MKVKKQNKKKKTMKENCTLIKEFAKLKKRKTQAIHVRFTLIR